MTITTLKTIESKLWREAFRSAATLFTSDFIWSSTGSLPCMCFWYIHQPTNVIRVYTCRSRSSATGEVAPYISKPAGTSCIDRIGPLLLGLQHANWVSHLAVFSCLFRTKHVWALGDGPRLTPFPPHAPPASVDPRAFSPRSTSVQSIRDGTTHSTGAFPHKGPVSAPRRTCRPVRGVARGVAGGQHDRCVWSCQSGVGQWLFRAARMCNNHGEGGTWPDKEDHKQRWWKEEASFFHLLCRCSFSFGGGNSRFKHLWTKSIKCQSKSRVPSYDIP